ncbi:hypothetical protein [uncultured Dysosmobacter sp.]|uniref:hypothetical protein n=1 Tax=uncultured Dysosmobacter sp. TaxID=2591384 RepID=UPI00262A0A39|nr:hypothetical protein [uncultured Dysosmobacter sp.]
MQQYVNKFFIAMNEDKSEVIINFAQNVPTIPESATVSPDEFEVQVIPVAGLVMTGEFAENLAKSLSNLLTKE